jgi:hypothetical protein
MRDDSYSLPGTTYHSQTARRLAGRLGLDFVMAIFKFFNRQLGENEAAMLPLFIFQFDQIVLTIPRPLLTSQTKPWRASLGPQCHRRDL